MSGRPPKPTAMRVIEGDRGKRGRSKQEPDPEYLAAENMVAPAWLPAAAKVVWDELVPALQKARLVAVIDVELLAHGCAAIAMCRKATIRAHKKTVIAGKDGAGDSLSPWLIVQSMSFKQLNAVLLQFGVGPAARTRIAIQPQMDLFGNGEGEKDAKYFAR